MLWLSQDDTQAVSALQGWKCAALLPEGETFAPELCREQADLDPSSLAPAADLSCFPHSLTGSPRASALHKS